MKLACTGEPLVVQRTGDLVVAKTNNAIPAVLQTVRKALLQGVVVAFRLAGKYVSSARVLAAAIVNCSDLPSHLGARFKPKERLVLDDEVQNGLGNRTSPVTCDRRKIQDWGRRRRRRFSGGRRWVPATDEQA